MTPENLYYDITQQLQGIVQIGREKDAPNGIITNDAGSKAVMDAFQRILDNVQREKENVLSAIEL